MGSFAACTSKSQDPNKDLVATSLNYIYTLRITSISISGVSAENNTRESIYNPLRRGETFAINGTSLKLCFFGCWDFSKTPLGERNWIAAGYAHGVAMGSDLQRKLSSVTASTFAIWAVKDPSTRNLDPVQVIKIWEADGQQKEKVYDAVWSGNRRADQKTGKLPAVGNTVDLKIGRYASSIGAETVWKDPEFNPQHSAAYHSLVLEIPTPRWSTFLALQNGLRLPNDVPPITHTQQRGWSSPIS